MTQDSLTGSYLGHNRRSPESEDRILHTSVWEARGKDQDIVFAPSVGVDNFLIWSVMAP
jgi:hypothetical protein